MLTLKSKQKLAAKLLKLPIEEIEANAEEIEDLNALYYATKQRVGGAIIVGADGQVLFANSSVSYAMHLRDYRNGKRTPLESFDLEENIDDQIVTDITRLKKGTKFVLNDYFVKYGVKTRDKNKMNKIVREKLAHLGVKLETPKNYKGETTHAYEVPDVKKN